VDFEPHMIDVELPKETYPNGNHKGIRRFIEVPQINENVLQGKWIFKN
jgi:hypothetical protein